MGAIGHKLEAGTDYISKFSIGLYTMRSPLFAPMSALGLQMISHLDTLWDGVNTDISHKNTLIRRPGFVRYSTAQLGTAEFPLDFSSFRNTSGTIKAMVDTNTRVAWFDATSVNTVLTKTTSNQTSFQKVGDILYICNGEDADAKSWDGTTLYKWGIVAPAVAPSISFVSGTLSPTAGYSWVYCYARSATGHVSTASPVSANTGPRSSKDFTISGAGSTDPQVDTIQIYRTDDGGSVYYYVATISNTTTWTYTDSTTDAAIQNQVVAPRNHLNDPPPSGISLVCFYLGRMWVATGNKLYFGGGGDITNGVPEECFPPANVFVLPGNITAMAPTSNGLAVWTGADAWVILGSDVASFYPRSWQANFGVPNQNCVKQDGDNLYVLTSKGQLFSYSGGLTEVGFAIQNLIGTFTPANSYIALHRSGVDEGLFVCDGSTNVYRYSISLGSWSTKMEPVGGVKCLQSIEVTPGNYRLMMGRTTGNGYILVRDPNTFSDDGVAYPANAVVGSILMAPPRQVVTVNSILTETMAVGTYPTVSVLLNEISGTFTVLPNPVPDPPLLKQASTVWMKRHDLKAAQTPLPQSQVRHLQIKVDFGTQIAANEILGIGVA